MAYALEGEEEENCQNYLESGINTLVSFEQGLFIQPSKLNPPHSPHMSCPAA
jgi:hypothetical protein